MKPSLAYRLIASCLMIASVALSVGFVQASEKEIENTMRFAPASDFTNVATLDEAIARIGKDGNIAPLLLQMMENHVIVAVYVEEEERGKAQVSFNPLILGDDEFIYTPFFDSQKAYEGWLGQFPELDRDAVVPIILEGTILFPALSQGENLNAVLNPHLNAREIIYHSNLVWIRNQVEALSEYPEAKVMSNMTVFLPDSADQARLIADLSGYLKSVQVVERGYFFVVESYDRETNIAVRNVLVVVDSTNTISQQDIDAMEQAFEFKPEKYQLANDFTLSFMVLPQNDVGEQMTKQEAFYHKE